MKTEPRVGIILINYKNYAQTMDCINSLKQIQYDDYYVIIVDNDSQNESYEELKKCEDARIKIIQSGKNGGFAFGNNVGIEYARQFKCDYYLLLNNDTLVEPDFLKKMVADAEISQAGITTCRIMYDSEREKVWYAGGQVDWWNSRSTHMCINQPAPQNDSIRTVSFVSGCCMLISKKCVSDAGVLPEEYFMYYEDLDYCVHVAECGYSLRYVPNAVIYHCVSSSSGGESSPFVIEWSNRSRRKFMRKYSYNLGVIKYTIISVKCEIRELCKILLKGNIKNGLNAFLESFRKGKI